MVFWSCYLFIRGLARSFEGVSICCIWLSEAGAHTPAVKRLFKNLQLYRKARHITLCFTECMKKLKILWFCVNDWITVVPWSTTYILLVTVLWKVISTQHMFPGFFLWCLSGEEDLNHVILSNNTVTVIPWSYHIYSLFLVTAHINFLGILTKF